VSLYETAVEARARAYAAYSNYLVGAAVESASGQVFSGANIENISYGATVCAERVAIWKMVESGERVWRRIAVVTADGGTPCGMCLQVMSEFAANEAEVIVGTPEGPRHTYRFRDLMPHAFSSDKVGPDK
jgi:cytidine deaminase